MNRVILVQCIVVILISCSASKKSIINIPARESVTVKEIPVTVPPSTQVQKDTMPVVFKIDTVLKMSRGSCFGKCPVYDCVILNDGTVIWRGDKNTPKLGMHISKLDQKKINELQQNAKHIISQEFKTFYPEKKHEVIDDFPTTIFQVFNKAESRKIVINNSAPKILNELRDKIDDWLATTEWIKIQP